jgi:L-iditol 2-dehydrogenase
MKSIRLTAANTLQFFDEPIPAPCGNETLIQVKTVGVCGSDLLWFKTAGIGDARLDKPLVLGHEFMGITLDGERVAIDPAIPCGKCEFCLQGNPNLCPSVIFAGHGDHDGGLREYVSWEKSCLHPLPDSISDAEGAMLEPLGVAIHAIDLAHLKPGFSVGVFGCGPIGLLIIQLARLAGASLVVATETLPHRVDAARASGADHVIRVFDKTDSAEVLSFTHNRGVDVAFDVSGTPDAVTAAFNAVIPGGKVVLVGIPEDDQTAFTASNARRKGLTIKMVRRMKLTYPRAIDLVSNHKIDVKSIITSQYPYTQSQEAFQAAARRDGLKVIIHF